MILTEKKIENKCIFSSSTKNVFNIFLCSPKACWTLWGHFVCLSIRILFIPLFKCPALLTVALYLSYLKITSRTCAGCICQASPIYVRYPSLYQKCHMTNLMKFSVYRILREGRRYSLQESLGNQFNTFFFMQGSAIRVRLLKDFLGWKVMVLYKN